MKKLNDLNSMSPEDFEKKLKQHPMRPVPAEWRVEILAAAKSAAAPVKPVGERVSIWEDLGGWFSEAIGLRPRVLAALGAVWVVIVALHLMTHSDASAGAQRLAKSAPVTQDMIVEVREQRLFYAELVGEREPREAERPKKFLDRPRSERREWAVTI